MKVQSLLRFPVENWCMSSWTKQIVFINATQLIFNLILTLYIISNQVNLLRNIVNLHLLLAISHRSSEPIST